MNRRLRNEPQIWRLAADLGLKNYTDPVDAVRTHCRARLRQFARDGGCATLSELLGTTAAFLDTSFVEVSTTAEIAAVQNTYRDRDEPAIAALGVHLRPDVFAVTFRRQNRAPGERAYPDASAASARASTEAAARSPDVAASMDRVPRQAHRHEDQPDVPGHDRHGPRDLVRVGEAEHS